MQLVQIEKNKFIHSFIHHVATITLHAWLILNACAFYDANTKRICQLCVLYDANTKLICQLCVFMLILSTLVNYVFSMMLII